MKRVPGALATKALLDVGLGHDDVVRALKEEIALSAAEAEAAWRYVMEGTRVRGITVVDAGRTLGSVPGLFDPHVE